MADAFARPTAPPGLTISDPSDRANIESKAEEYENFEDIWSEISTSMGELRLETEPDARLNPENLLKALAASFAFPDEVRVERNLFDRHVDLSKHVRGHFKSLHTRRDELRTVLGWGMDDILRAAEIIYIDDAVFRFVTVISFLTEDEELGDIRFNSYPAESTEWMVEWMENADIMWSPIRGERSIDGVMDNLMEDLHDKRKEFVTRAIEADIFSPISTADTVNPEETKPNLKRRMRRGASSENLIHTYCYSRVESLMG